MGSDSASSGRVVHVPDRDCPPAVVELEDRFGSAREVYLSYDAAENLRDDLDRILEERES